MTLPPWLAIVALAALAVLLLVGAAVVVLLVRVVRVGHKVDLVSARVDRVGGTLKKQADRRAVDQEKVLDRLTTANRTLRQVRDKDVPRLHGDSRALGTRLAEDQRKRFRALRDHVTTQGRHDYQQGVAWQELHALLAPERPMPALRGWAASPDLLCILVEAIRARPPRLVVECGSGASSVWLGLALRRFGGGRLVALEQDGAYAERSRELVAAHGLGDVVEIRHAPLQPWSPGGDQTPQPWYDLAAVRDLADIDLVLVDGPPQDTGPMARYPAGPVLIPRCATHAAIVLDDAARDDELACVDRWVEAHPDLRRTTVATEKGTVVLSRG